MTGPLTFGEDVALFIDWENFKISLATGRRAPNVSALKEEVANLGRVVVAKAYADWVSRAPELKGASQFINDPPALYAAGIEPVYVPTRIFTGTATSSEFPRGPRVKNSVDVKMTADCIECAHSYPNIGTFVLVSGDSDFIHVVNTLRTMGKRVVVIGVTWSTSRRLADQVDGLILYDVDIDPVAAPEALPAGNGRVPSRVDGVSRVELAEVIREIEEIVRTERQAGGTPLLTSIKQRVMRRFPGFDEKQLGFSGFKRLMARVAHEGNIKLITAGLVDWATMADESQSPESPADTAGAREERSVASRGRRSAPAQSSPADDGLSAVEETEPSEAIPPGAEDIKAEIVESQLAPMTPALEALLTEATTGLDLPQGPEDGMNLQRIVDVIVMADTLEHREGISHVAFNFLLAEVCQALEQGLEAEYSEITQRWSQVYSRSYVSKMFRGLSTGNLFLRGWHSWRDETSGVQRRRRTFNLDRSHPAVEEVLKTRWENGDSRDGDAMPPEQMGLESVDTTGPLEATDDAQPFDNDAEKSVSGFLSRLFHSRSD